MKKYILQLIVAVVIMFGMMAAGKPSAGTKRKDRSNKKPSRACRMDHAKDG